MRSAERVKCQTTPRSRGHHSLQKSLECRRDKAKSARNRARHKNAPSAQPSDHWFTSALASARTLRKLLVSVDANRAPPIWPAPWPQRAVGVSPPAPLVEAHCLLAVPSRRIEHRGVDANCAHPETNTTLRPIRGRTTPMHHDAGLRTTTVWWRGQHIAPHKSCSNAPSESMSSRVGL